MVPELRRLVGSGVHQGELVYLRELVCLRELMRWWRRHTQVVCNWHQGVAALTSFKLVSSLPLDHASEGERLGGAPAGHQTSCRNLA